MIFVYILISFFITHIEGTHNTNGHNQHNGLENTTNIISFSEKELWIDALQRIKPVEIKTFKDATRSLYEWRPLVSHEELSLNVESFLLIDWRAIIHYSCLKKTALVPYQELDNHLQAAELEMSNLDISPENIKKIIDLTAFNYAVQNTKKDAIIKILNENNVELNPNQTLVVDDFFARPEYEPCLTLFLNQEKHDQLKTLLTVFTRQKYDTTLTLLELRYKQIEYQKTLYQNKIEPMIGNGNFSWIDKDTPLYRYPFNQYLEYCFSYLLNNDREINYYKKVITMAMEKKAPEDYSRLKKLLLNIGTSIKKLEEKIETQRTLRNNLRAIAALHITNTVLDHNDSLDDELEYPDHIKKANKAIENNIISIEKITNTIQENRIGHLLYVKNHYSDRLAKLKDLQAPFIKKSTIFFNEPNSLKANSKGPMFKKDDPSEVIMEYLIKERLYFHVLAQKFQISIRNKTLPFEYLSTLEDHKKNVEELLEKNIIKESYYVTVLNRWKQDIDQIFIQYSVEKPVKNIKSTTSKKNNHSDTKDW